MEEQGINHEESFDEPSLKDVLTDYPWGEELLKRLIEYHPDTLSHSERVAKVLWDASRNQDYTPEERRTLYAAGLFHDFGKLGTPEDILDKAGVLDDDERGEMQMHVRLSVDIIRNNEEPDSLLEQLVGAHHPAYGNPFSENPHIRDMQVMLAATDMADAAMSRRAYKEPYSKERTLDILNAELPGEKGLEKIVDLRGAMAA